MTAWIKRERQTRTKVDDKSSERISRKRGQIAAYRAMAAVQITVQLILWIMLKAYDKGMQTTWQSALMLAVPVIGLYLLWTAGKGGLSSNAARFWLLALIPCLLIDAAVLVTVLDAFVSEMMPAYSPVLRLAIIGFLSLWAVCGARQNGVAYGVAALRHVLLLAFALGTFLLNADINVDRLHPLLGGGVSTTALNALEGIGGVWGVSLLFALPGISRVNMSIVKIKRRGAWIYALLPLVLCVVLALWLGLARPWRADDAMTMGERLMGLARNSRSILICELVGVGWLLALPCALFGCVRSGESLLSNAFPKLPRLLGTLAVLMPAVVYAFFCGNNGLGFAEAIMPYRIVLGAAAGIAVLVCGIREAGKN